MALTDRRSSPRTKSPGIAAWVLVRNGEPERCNVIDASRNGALIESSLFLMPGMTVELAFIRKQNAKVTRLLRRWVRVARSSRNDLAVYFVKERSVVRTSSSGVWPYSGRE
jgi:hypothetical protein